MYCTWLIRSTKSRVTEQRSTNFVMSVSHRNYFTYSLFLGVGDTKLNVIFESNLG